jgi:hypothetical protein
VKTARRRSCLVLAGSVLLGPVGCGGGVPATGSRAVLPEGYQQREKEIMDAFKAELKKPANAARR